MLLLTVKEKKYMYNINLKSLKQEEYSDVCSGYSTKIYN